MQKPKGEENGVNQFRTQHDFDRILTDKNMMARLSVNSSIYNNIQGSHHYQQKIVKMIKGGGGKKSVHSRIGIMGGGQQKHSIANHELIS